MSNNNTTRIKTFRDFDDAEKLAQLQIMFDESEKHDEDFKSNGILAKNFVDGNQWTEEELLVLRKRKQPAVTINKIKPVVNTICSLQKGNRSDISYKPQDSSKHDFVAAKGFSIIAKHDMKLANYQDIESKAFDDYVITGRGVVQGYFDAEHERSDYQYVDFRNFYPDPSSKYDDLRDAEYIHVAQYMSEIDAAITLGELEANNEIELGESEEHLIGALSRDRTRVIQTWVRVPVRNKKGIWKNQYDCVIWTSSKIIKSYENPYPSMKRFPIMQMTLYRDLDNRPYGVVKGLIDPQRVLNHSRSKASHILNTNKFVVRAESFDGSSEKLKEELASPDTLLELENGKEDLEDISQKQDLNGLISMMTYAEGSIPQIAGISEELEGTGGGSMSGKAIHLRQQSGINRLTEIFDGLKQFKNEVGRTQLSIMTDYYPTTRIIRILESGGKSDNKEAAKKIAQVWNQIKVDSVKEFDVVHSTDPITISQQEEDYNNLLQIYSMNPNAMPLQVLVSASNWKNKDEVISHLDKHDKIMQQLQAQGEQLKQASQQMQMLQKNAESQMQELIAKLEQKDNTIIKLMQKMGVDNLLPSQQ